MKIGEKVKFCLDGNPFHSGEGILKEERMSCWVVELSTDCKEHKKGDLIFVSRDEFV